MVESARAYKNPGPSAGELSAGVGKRIREARHAKGMSLAEVGGDDLTRSFLSLVENGHSRISLRALGIVANRLDLPVSYFLQSESAGTDAIELALDRVEAALKQLNPGEALHLLQDLEVPPQLRARGRWLHGWALSATDRLRQAIPVLREALDLCLPSGDTFLLTEIRYRLGVALYEDRLYDEALAYLREAQEEAATPPRDTTMLARSTAVIGRILCMRGDSDGAIEHYRRAQEIFGSVSSLDVLPSVYSDLSLAYERKGELRQALNFSKRGLGMHDAKFFALEAARELNNIASRYLEQGKLEEARNSAQDALDRASRAGAPSLVADARATLADVHLHLEDYDAAAREALSAEELADGDEDPARIIAWRVLGSIAEHEARPEDADRLYTRALDQLQRIEKQHRYGEVALEYSQILQKRGDFKRALEYALEAANARGMTSVQ